MASVDSKEECLASWLRESHREDVAGKQFTVNLYGKKLSSFLLLFNIENARQDTNLSRGIFTDEISTAVRNFKIYTMLLAHSVNMNNDFYIHVTVIRDSQN